MTNEETPVYLVITESQDIVGMFYSEEEAEELKEERNREGEYVMQAFMSYVDETTEETND